MKFKLVLAILAVFMMTPYAWAEPWWENAQIQQTLTQKSIDQEVCGSGIDEDGVGGDAPCPGGDSDMDGYKDDVDCEPFNKFVYPGISTTCDINGGTANGWKTCQSDGTFTACVDSAVQPLCEAQGDGHCYYFDPVNGDNGNDGSYEHPWKDYAKINHHAPGEYTPQPGDVFYFMSGTYNPYYKPDYPSDASSGYQGFWLSGVGDDSSHPIIIKNYPGEHPIFSADNNSFDVVCLYQSNNCIFEGIEITSKPDIYHEKGFSIVESENIFSRNLYVHDVNSTNCGGNNGCVAFWSHVKNSEIRTSITHDCLKVLPCVNYGNVRTIFINDVKGRINVMYNTVFTRKDWDPSQTGEGSVPTFINSKHGSHFSGVSWEVAYNVLYGPPVRFTGVGTSQYNTHFHHNIMFNAEYAIDLHSSGSGSHCNIKFEYNTLVNCNAYTLTDLGEGVPVFLDPETGENPTDCENIYGNPDFNHNIITHSTHATAFNFESGFMEIHVYGADNSYEYLINGNKLKMDYNVYYSYATDLKTNPYAVSLFSGASATQYGACYSFNQWQTDTTTKPFNYDVHSFVEDPLLKTDDGSFMPQNPNAKDKGWLAGATTEVIWDIDGDKKWSLPDIIYGLEVLAGKRK